LSEKYNILWIKTAYLIKSGQTNGIDKH